MKRKIAVPIFVVLLLALLAGCAKPMANVFSTKPQVAVRYKNLDFLTEEQQTLYQQAYELYPAMVYSTEGWQFAHAGQEYITTEIDGVVYHRLEGEYADWEAFKALWLGTFTEGWFEQANSYYREIDGYTWVVVGAKSGPWVPENTYYEIGFMRDDMIVFYANPQYEDEFDGMEEAVEWQEYHMIQFVLTKDGWRCQQFGR